MNLIRVPKPPQSAMNPDRAVSGLLKAQIQHLHDAERNLPLRYRTDIYINAIKTEGEAAEYIRQVTEAIHKAHEDAAAKRVRPVIRRKRGIAFAAAAAERSARKSNSVSKAKTAKKKNKPKRGLKT
jgi:hypothetical protein